MTDDQNDNLNTPEFAPEENTRSRITAFTQNLSRNIKSKSGGFLTRLRFWKKSETPEFGEAPAFEPGTARLENAPEDATAEISSSGVLGSASASAAPKSEAAGFGASAGMGSARRMELLNIAEWFSQNLQSRGYAFYGKLFTLVTCCYFLADVLALMAGKYIPEPPTTRSMRPMGTAQRAKTLEEYNPIFARNLFNRKGLIPGEENPSGPADMGGAPVKTSLPFNLIGTLILRDEMRSIATIEDKAASMVYPVRIDEEIPTKARIIKIEPRRVIFVNTQSGRREFIELPDEPTNSTRISVGAPKSGTPGIEQVGGNQFNIQRSEVDNALKDFNKILTEARAVPNFENGAPAGYKLFQIVPGSIYDKLGLKNGDTIMGVDGAPINDPAKAFELLGKLKEGASHMELAIKRADGKTQTMTYDIH